MTMTLTDIMEALLDPTIGTLWFITGMTVAAAVDRIWGRGRL